ncbi:hypothetical protein D3C86_1379970 [compost metagenome]
MDTDNSQRLCRFNEGDQRNDPQTERLGTEHTPITMIGHYPANTLNDFDSMATRHPVYDRRECTSHPFGAESTVHSTVRFVVHLQEYGPGMRINTSNGQRMIRQRGLGRLGDRGLGCLYHKCTWIAWLGLYAVHDLHRDDGVVDRWPVLSRSECTLAAITAESARYQIVRRGIEHLQIGRVFMDTNNGQRLPRFGERGRWNNGQFERLGTEHTPITGIRCDSADGLNDFDFVGTRRPVRRRRKGASLPGGAENSAYFTARLIKHFRENGARNDTGNGQHLLRRCRIRWWRDRRF